MDIHMGQPPAQDAPNHILNALNSDCLQECFRRLPTHADFLNVASVYNKFRANARASKLKHFDCTFEQLIGGKQFGHSIRICQQNILEFF